MKEVLLSVVIPTRNRQEYVFEAVSHILSIGGSEIQIVIQDNSANDSLRELIQSTMSPQIKYDYVQERLSFVDNFSLALENADGEYVCVIGDDDSILPDIIPATRYARDNEIDVMVPNVSFEYFWPDSIYMDGRIDGVVRCLSGELNIRYMKTKHALKKLMRQGGQDYVFLDVAKLYHGIVKKACLDKIKQMTGCYFGGLSPDIYMSVALSNLNLKVAKISVPLTIAGVCPTSGSAQSTKGEHVGDYEDAPHLQGHKYYNWSELVPKFYSVETIWADSALAAVVAMNDKEMLKEFSVSEICAVCHARYPKYRELIMSHWHKYRESLPLLNKLHGDYRIISYPLRNIVRRAFRRFSRLNKKLTFLHGISNIAMAACEYENKIRKGYLYYDKQNNNLIWRNNQCLKTKL